MGVMLVASCYWGWFVVDEFIQQPVWRKSEEQTMLQSQMTQLYSPSLANTQHPSWWQRGEMTYILNVWRLLWCQHNLWQQLSEHCSVVRCYLSAVQKLNSAFVSCGDPWSTRCVATSALIWTFLYIILWCSAFEGLKTQVACSIFICQES